MIEAMGEMSESERLAALESARRTILRHTKREHRGAAQVCRALCDVKERRLYEAKKYRSVEAWAAAEVDLRRSQASTYVRVGLGFAPEVIAEHGTTKLEAVLKFLGKYVRVRGPVDLTGVDVAVERDGVPTSVSILDATTAEILDATAAAHRGSDVPTTREGADEADQKIAQMLAVGRKKLKHLKIKKYWPKGGTEYLLTLSGIPSSATNLALNMLANASIPGAGAEPQRQKTSRATRPKKKRAG